MSPLRGLRLPSGTLFVILYNGLYIHFLLALSLSLFLYFVSVVVVVVFLHFQGLLEAPNCKKMIKHKMIDYHK